MRRWGKRLFLLLLAGLLTIGTAGAAFAASAGRRTVRVGFFPFEGYHMMDAEGNRSGYGYDYLQKMLDFAGWTYEYVGYEDGIGWSDMLQMLQDGKIDLLTSAVKTPAREAVFDFSDEPIGTSSALLTVRAGETRYATDDFSGWDGIQVGLLTGNSRNDSFAAYAREHGFTYEAVYFDSSDALARALADGTVDAAVTSNLRRITNEWVVAQFDAKPFYVIVKKGNQALLDEANAAIGQLTATLPGLQNELFQKYYSADSGDQIAFTEDERAFISECQSSGTVFRAIIDPDRKPYSYVENGRMTGMLTEICREIFRRTGLSVTIETPASRDDYLTLKSDPSVAIVCDICGACTRAEKQGYIAADPYYEATVSRLYRKNFTGEPARVCVVRGSAVSELMAGQMGQDVTLITCDNVGTCVQAVKKGAADAAYLPTYVAQGAVYSDVTNQLNSVTIPGVTRAFSLGIQADEPYLLASVLEKASLSITDAEVTSLCAPYTFYKASDMTLLGLIYSRPILLICAVAALLLIAFLAVGMVFLRKKQKAEAQSNAALREAAYAAEQASRAKSRFLSQMSHEIRTPMNAIVGLTAIARQYEHDPARMEACLEKIDGASRILLSLISDVLDMSAIENDKLKLARTEFDIRDVLNGVASIYDAQCRQKGLRFSMTADLQDAFYIGDSLRVSQILLNLLSNAYKFTDPGGKIGVKASESEKKDGKALLTFVVSDTGTGMSPEMVQRLFRPFEQESADTARKYGGSGLGLSITKNLVSLMGGSIDVRSEKGAGTVFTVALPFECAGPDNAGAGIPSAEDGGQADPSAREPYDFTGRRVLVAEDNRLNREVDRGLLELVHMQADYAENGAEAVRLFAENPPGTYDAILMDVQMPVMDGHEATRAIRALDHPQAGTIPIYAMTADAFTEDVNAALACGMNGHVAKPIDAEDLYRRLAEAVSGRRPSPDAPQEQR